MLMDKVREDDDISIDLFEVTKSEFSINHQDNIEEKKIRKLVNLGGVPSKELRNMIEKEESLFNQ